MHLCCPRSARHPATLPFSADLPVDPSAAFVHPREPGRCRGRGWCWCRCRCRCRASLCDREGWPGRQTDRQGRHRSSAAVYSNTDRYQCRARPTDCLRRQLRPRQTPPSALSYTRLNHNGVHCPRKNLTFRAKGNKWGLISNSFYSHLHTVYISSSYKNLYRDCNPLASLLIIALEPR